MISIWVSDKSAGSLGGTAPNPAVAAQKPPKSANKDRAGKVYNHRIIEAGRLSKIAAIEGNAYLLSPNMGSDYRRIKVLGETECGVH